MGKFTLTIKKSTDEKDDTKKNTNALKILTYIMYYVYYNTFEDPLNNHFYERLSDVPSEKSSPSFNITILNMLNNSNKYTNIDDTTSDVYSKIIDILSKNISNNLERDLFKDLRATTLINAVSKTKKDLKEEEERTEGKGEEEGEEGEGEEEDKEDDKEDKDLTKYDYMLKTQNMMFCRLLKEEEYIYVILALKTVNDLIDSHNKSLMLPEILEEQLTNYSNKKEVNVSKSFFPSGLSLPFFPIKKN
jgi:hypothetical protein